MTLPIYISDPAGKRYRSQETFDYITAFMYKTVVDFVERSGYTAVVNAVPDMLNTGDVSLEGYGGLVLMGGFDIDSAFYTKGGRLSSSSYPEVDMYELGLIYEAVRLGLPVLGICRGMQLINVAFGGTLYKDIGYIAGVKHNNFGAVAYEHQAVTHVVEVVNSSVLDNGEYTVAASHHQAVNVVGDTLTVTARCSDGIIEMVENSELNVIGVQWHPEASHVTQDNTLSPLLSAFIKAIPGSVVPREVVSLTRTVMPLRVVTQYAGYTSSSYFADYYADDECCDDESHYYMDDDSALCLYNNESCYANDCVECCDVFEEYFQ